MLSSILHLPATLSSGAIDRAATVFSLGHLRAVLAASHLPTCFSVQAVVHDLPLGTAVASTSVPLAALHWLLFSK